MRNKKRKKKVTHKHRRIVYWQSQISFHALINRMLEIIVSGFNTYLDSRDGNDFRARDGVCRESAVIYVLSLFHKGRYRWATIMIPRTTTDVQPRACTSYAVT